jgi:uncharacterized protein
VHAGDLDLQDEEKSTSLDLCFVFATLIERAMSEKSRDVFVYNKTKETFLAFRVRVADSILGRLVGLLGRKSLRPDSGVWIVPANAVHTVGMLFSFDVLMIDKDFKVVGMRELVRPFRLVWPNLKAESVIELPAHTIFKSRTEIGDQLVIDRYEASDKRPAEVVEYPVSKPPRKQVVGIDEAKRQHSYTQEVQK